MEIENINIAEFILVFKYSQNVKIENIAKIV